MASDLGTPYAGERIDEPATRSPACPACGRHSQPEAAFCAFCGTALVHQRVPGPPVFAAVATAIEGRSAYEVLSEVGSSFEALGAVFEGVSQHPATLVALFPPKEDAAAVAARAALDAVERCPRARVGIDASEVTEHSDQDAIWQDLIDRSAQLGAAGAPGAVVASEAIPALTEGAAVVEPVDGVTGTTWLRELRDLGAAAGVDAAPAKEHVFGASTSFVGRDRELAELRSRFDMVVDEGRADCIAIVGEPGIGTTRLAEEFVGSLDRVRRFVLRCDDELDGGAWPLAAFIETIAGISRWDEPTVAREKLERLLAQTGDPGRPVERLASLLALDDAGLNADETRWALRTLIEAATLGPSVLLVDDVDRAAFGFAAFLGDVARALRSTPLLIVCTASSEPAGVPDTIVLPALDDAASRAVIASRLGDTDADAAAAILTSFGGTPLLLEHGLALFVETSALVRDTDRWVADGDLATRGSGSLREAIGERLHAMPEDLRAVAALAAAAGPVVAIEDLGAGTEDRVAALVEMGLLAEGEEAHLRWTHATVREAAAAGETPAAAAGLLRRRARRDLEAAGPRRPRFAASAGSMLAESARIAGDEAVDADRSEALELLVPAAVRAAAAGDPAGASILERRAAGLLPADDPRRAELSFLSALHVSSTGRIPETEAAINDAIAATIAVSGDATDHHVRILRASVRAASDRTTLDAARAIADEAYERFTELDDAWGRSRAAALRGQVHAARGHAAATYDDLLEAADLARVADRPADAAAALRGAGRALLDGPMPVDEALDRCAALRTSAVGHLLPEHDLAGVHAVLLARRGRSPEARDLIAATIAAIEELAADADLAVALHRSGVIWWLGGEFHAAEPPIQRALAAAGLARDDRLRARIAASWANLVLATEDRVDEAMALADVAETWATDPAALVGWRTARARALVRVGDAETADRLGREAVSLAEQTDSTDLRANALLHLAEVLRLSGRPAESIPFQRRAFRILDRKGSTAQAAAIFRQLGSDATEDLVATEAPPTTDELRADDDLEPGSPPYPDRDGPEDPPVSAAPHAEETTREGEEAPADPVAEADETRAPVPEPVEPPPAQPIASSFAASSDGEPRKKGLFRR